MIPLKAGNDAGIFWEKGIAGSTRNYVAKILRMILIKKKR